MPPLSPNARKGDAAEAAIVTTAGPTAWRTLVVDGKRKASDTLLLLRKVGIWVGAPQVAKTMGTTVGITSSAEAKLERARGLGADFTLNHRKQPGWDRAIRDRTGGRGVDHGFQVGVSGTLAQPAEAVRVGGNISLIGVLTGVSGEVPTAALMVKRVRLPG